MLKEDDIGGDDQSDIASIHPTTGTNQPPKNKYAGSIASAKTHSSKTSNRSTRSAIGYTPVPKEMLEASKE